MTRYDFLVNNRLFVLTVIFKFLNFFSERQNLTKNKYKANLKFDRILRKAKRKESIRKQIKRIWCLPSKSRRQLEQKK